MGTTKAITATAFAVVILGTLFVGLAMANGNNSSSYILNSEAKEELVAFVNEAKDFVLAEGKDKALQVFNDPKGKFSRGELYIIAHDINGTILAHPYAHETVGLNRLNVADPNGVTYASAVQNLDKRGGGFTYFIRPNPAHSNALGLRLNYDLKVDEGLYLGSCIYLPGPAPIFSNESRKDLVAFVESARKFALNHTKEEALKAFNDPKGKFVKGELYISAYDFNGMRLAHPYLLETIGQNVLNDTDPNGVTEVRNRRDLAANYGSGFIYYIWPNPARSNAWELKLGYITKVNDEWFLGSGIYNDPYILEPEDREELVSLVNEAKDFVLTEGKDKAFQVLSDPKGMFVKGELYVFAVDANNTNLAHPYLNGSLYTYALDANRTKLAQWGWYFNDINGVNINKIYKNLIKRGGGFLYTVFFNPAHSNILELKLNYMLKVNENLYLCSGRYLPGNSPVFSNESRKDLIAFVENARGFALNHTKEEALKAFNDRNGKFARGEFYIIAYDFNGTRLAHPYMPDAISKNALNSTDPNGVTDVRDMHDLAANYGSGFIYYIWPNPAHSNAWELKRAYVTKVNDEWFLASGIYASGA